MMAFGSFAKLTTLDEAFLAWDNAIPGWHYGTFGDYIIWLKGQGWKIL